MPSSGQARSAIPPFRREPLSQSGAYALVRDGSGRILLVRAQNGRFYLPGGRIEPGEDACAALEREIVEECGWSAVVEAPLGKARQQIMGGIELEATYWRVHLLAPDSMNAEHDLFWVEPSTASELLHRTGDRAIVEAAVKNGLESVA